MAETQPVADVDERAWLVTADHTASQTYDKLVITLGGGALGLSLAFMRDVVTGPKEGTTIWLGASWILLVLSLMFTFTSLLTSQASLRRGMKQIDAGEKKRLGGAWATVTWALNIGAGIQLVAGVFLLVAFALLNVERG